MSHTGSPGNRQGLAERLRERIAERGPITFAEFMEAALYDPEEGFYSRVPVGETGDFVTSPHVSPVFGILLARQVEDFWELLGRPDPFVVLEVGAGDGTLARQVVEALPQSLASATRYVAVERSPAGRATMADLPVAIHEELAEVPPVPHGCVIANELLDNLPFHRLRGTDHAVAELYVATEASRFVLREGPPSSPVLARGAPSLRPGEEAVMNLAALDFLRDAASVLGRGYVWLADYGPEPGRPVSAVVAFRAHGVASDELEDPGSRDITAGVDFAQVGRFARSKGWAVWGPALQRRVLLALGFRELDRRAQARQVEAVAARRGIEALRIYSNRTRANALLGRAGLGSFHVLCIGIGVDAEATPLSFRDGVAPPGRAGE